MPAAEGPSDLLLSDPFEVFLELRSLPELCDGVELAREALVVERGVDRVVTAPAKVRRRSEGVLLLLPARPRNKVMFRGLSFPTAQLASHECLVEPPGIAPGLLQWTNLMQVVTLGYTAWAFSNLTGKYSVGTFLRMIAAFFFSNIVYMVLLMLIIVMMNPEVLDVFREMSGKP